MYLLEMIEEAGYEGIYTTSIVCSEDKEKLHIIAMNLKQNLLDISMQMNNFRSYLDNKYSSIRVQCRRTSEEIVEVKEYEEKLKSSYPDILKYDLFGTWYSASDIEFEVIEIYCI